MKIEVKPNAEYLFRVKDFKRGTAVWIRNDDEDESSEFPAIVTDKGYVPLTTGICMNRDWVKARPAHVKIVEDKQ